MIVTLGVENVTFKFTKQRYRVSFEVQSDDVDPNDLLSELKLSRLEDLFVDVIAYDLEVVDGTAAVQKLVKE